MTNYQQARKVLKDVKIGFKRLGINDKPMIRQVLNDTCDSLIKSNGLKLSEYKSRLLDNYCCKLHPK